MQKYSYRGPEVDVLTHVVKTTLRSTIEDAYRTGSYIHTRNRYINSFLKAFEFLDKGQPVLGTERQPVFIDGIPQFTGRALPIAMALAAHGLDASKRKKLAENSIKMNPGLKNCWDKAIPLVDKYEKFLPLAQQVEKNCEYAETDYGYYYSINAAPLRKYLNAMANVETLRMLFSMRAIDEFTKIETGSIKRLTGGGLGDGRSFEEISVAVLHLYAPVMEKLRYYKLAQEMNDVAFGVVDPQMASYIDSLKKKAGYTKTAFGTLDAFIREVVAPLESSMTIESRHKGDYSIYRKMLRRKAEATLKSEIPGFSSLQYAEKERLIIERINQYNRTTLQEKREWVREFIGRAYDLFGFRIIFDSQNATGEGCNALADVLMNSEFFEFAGYRHNYIGPNKKPNGYEADHVACRLSEKGIKHILETGTFKRGRFEKMPMVERLEAVKALLPLIVEFQISTEAMYLFNHYNEEPKYKDEIDHANHKKILDEDGMIIANTLTAVSETKEPFLKTLRLDIELYEPNKKGKPERTKTLPFKDIEDVYGLEFLSHKVEKELQDRGLAFSGFPAEQIEALEQVVGGAKHAKILVKVMKKESPHSTYDFSDAQAFPKRER